MLVVGDKIIYVAGHSQVGKFIIIRVGFYQSPFKKRLGKRYVYGGGENGINQ